MVSVGFRIEEIDAPTCDFRETSSPSFGASSTYGLRIPSMLSWFTRRFMLRRSVSRARSMLLPCDELM